MAANYFDALIGLQSGASRWTDGIDEIKANIDLPEWPIAYGGKILVEGKETESFFCLVDAPPYSWVSYIGDQLVTAHYGARVRDISVSPSRLLLIPGMQRKPHLMDPASLVYWRGCSFFQTGLKFESRRFLNGQAEIHFKDPVSGCVVARFLTNQVCSKLVAREHWDGERLITMVTTESYGHSLINDSPIVIESERLPDRPAATTFISLTEFFQQKRLDRFDAEFVGDEEGLSKWLQSRIEKTRREMAEELDSQE